MSPGDLPGEAVRPGQRVRVHYHLRLGGFSVVSTATGLVVANVSTITLAGVQFRVQAAGLDRIRRERRRAVCAYAVGAVTELGILPELGSRRRVSFNPYKA